MVQSTLLAKMRNGGRSPKEVTAWHLAGPSLAKDVDHDVEIFGGWSSSLKVHHFVSSADVQTHTIVTTGST